MSRIPRTGLTYGLVETLGQAVVGGAYDLGGFPTEAELSARFGASRTVTREAVKMLTAKGLLTSRPRQGTRIEPLPRWNLLDPDVARWLTARPYSNATFRQLTEVRLAIEPVAAALAARRASGDDLRAIRAGYDGMCKYAGRHDMALLADIEFHVAILRASGNAFLIQLTTLIRTALTLSIGLTNRIAGHTASLRDHEAVLLAIEARDEAGAEGALRAILRESLELMDSLNA